MDTNDTTNKPCLGCGRPIPQEADAVCPSCQQLHAIGEECQGGTCGSTRPWFDGID